jgi:hypothetical protein
MLSQKFIGILGYMTGIITNIHSGFHKKHIVLDMTNSYTCSFTEFLPFCIRLYYFSNFKDFSKLPQA